MITAELPNLFDQYSQYENRVTNALLQSLASSTSLLQSFLRVFVGIPFRPRKDRIAITTEERPYGRGDRQVGEKAPGERNSIPDGWIVCDQGDWAVAIESKVQLRSLRREQLQGHLRAISSSVHLHGLAYACRLYAQFTDYDAAIEILRQATEPRIDLENASHRAALLKWLNAWGCRQFSIKHHPMASQALRGWGRTNLSLLPPGGVSLTELPEAHIERVVPAYDRLCKLRAGIRSRQSKEYSVTFGPTGAAKILYALRPEVFPPWDEPIRSALNLDGSAEAYRRFLSTVQVAIRSVLEDARRFGITPSQIPDAIGPPGASLPKLIDEFYWVTITNGVTLPTPTDLEKWYRWSGAEQNQDEGR
jgi:hypothetical protein